MTLLDGLVSHWKLDEESGTRYDSHGEKHLAENGAGGEGPGPIGFVAGSLGNAADFTEDDQNLYTATNFQAGDGFTLAAWLKMTAHDTLVSLKVFQHDTVDGILVAFVEDDLIRVLVNGNDADSEVQYHHPIDTWFLLTAWYDISDGELHMLLDNSETGLSSQDGTTLDPVTAVGGLELGPIYTSGVFAPYSLDSVSFWSRALTSDERAQLWNNGDGLDYPFTPPVTRRTGGRNYNWQRYDEGQLQNERKLMAEMEAARRAVWQGERNK